jgi:two-component system cell cycle sensor histidine kinase PleC
MVAKCGHTSHSPKLFSTCDAHNRAWNTVGPVLNLAQKIAAVAERDESFDAAPAVLEALDALRVSVTVYDADLRLVYANTQFNYLFRSLPLHETLIGLGYDELVRLEVRGGEIAPCALGEGVDTFVAKRCAQLTAGEFRPLDIPLADGRIIEIKARRTENGGWILLWADMTEARHNSLRLEDAIALSADAFAFFDVRDKLVMCNALYAQLHGARSPADLRGWLFSDIITRSARKGRFTVNGDVEMWIERRLEMHQAPAGALTVSAASGDAYLVRDRAARDGGRVVVFTDVTDRKRAETALEEQTQTLTQTQSALVKSNAEAAQREHYLADMTVKLGALQAETSSVKTTLLRTMSHELKTPLNAIIGFSDLMRQMSADLTPEQVAEYATLIHQGGNNLLRLILQILDLTKIAAGRYELTRTSVDAGGALWNAKGDHDTYAQMKELTIDANACPLGLLVRADEHALRTMCGQLVENAVHFTPDGGRVTLSAEKIEGRVRLSVQDDGPGVDAEDLKRILEPFEQSARNRTTEHSYGAGLGLTLVKELAELHGGSLSVASEPGHGFTATIELPLA